MEVIIKEQLRQTMEEMKAPLMPRLWLEEGNDRIWIRHPGISVT
jgi:hypothetical protein